MLKRTPARKRNRAIKKIILRGLLVIGVVGLIGAGGFYFFFVQSHKPLYISPVGSLKVAETPEDDELGVFKKALSKNKIEFESVVASGSSYVVQLKSGGDVTFSSEKDTLKQISSLQFILSRLTMEGKLFSRLDLRFDKPVITIR